MPDTALRVSHSQFQYAPVTVHYPHLQMGKPDAWKGELQGQRGIAGNWGHWVSNPVLSGSKSKLSTTTHDSERRAKGWGLKEADILSQGEEKEEKPAKCPVREDEN